MQTMMRMTVLFLAIILESCTLFPPKCIQIFGPQSGVPYCDCDPKSARPCNGKWTETETGCTEAFGAWCGGAKAEGCIGDCNGTWVTPGPPPPAHPIVMVPDYETDNANRLR